MAADSGFCPRCGTNLVPGSAFCPKCGAPVAPSVGTSRAQRKEKHEKQEKNQRQEKREKNEKGSPASKLYAFVGGAVLVWLGITLYLQQAGILSSEFQGDYFLAGVGVILILDGLVLYSRMRGGIAPLAGGTCALVLGAGSIVARQLNRSQDVWPLIFVALGVCVIAIGVMARRRVPKP